MSKTYLFFTDKDGDPVIVPNDIVAIWTTTEKTEIRGFGFERTMITDTPMRVVRSRSGGEFEVTETTEEILARIQLATAAEE